MADLTSATTFTRFVQGNKRVVICDISSAGASTSDTVQSGLSAIEYLEGRFRGAIPAGTLPSTAVMSSVGAIWSSVRADSETLRTAIVNLAAGGGAPVLSVSTANAANFIVIRSTDAVGLGLQVKVIGR